jgi:hypothetical protein
MISGVKALWPGNPGAGMGSYFRKETVGSVIYSVSMKDGPH